MSVDVHDHDEHHFHGQNFVAVAVVVPAEVDIVVVVAEVDIVVVAEVDIVVVVDHPEAGWFEPSMTHRHRHDDFPDWAKFPRGVAAHSDWLVLNLMEVGSRQPSPGLRHHHHPVHYTHHQQEQERPQHGHNTFKAKDIGEPRRY